jgi:hypothetical protein
MGVSAIVVVMALLVIAAIKAIRNEFRVFIVGFPRFFPLT